MYTTIATLAFLAAALTEAYCIAWFAERLQERSQRRSEARREHYRELHYRAKNEEYKLKQSRQKLWEEVNKCR